LMSCESFPNSCWAQRSIIISIPTLKQVNDFILPYFDPMVALSGVPPAEEGKTFVYRISSTYNENTQSWCASRSYNKIAAIILESLLLKFSYKNAEDPFLTYHFVDQCTDRWILLSSCMRSAVHVLNVSLRMKKSLFKIYKTVDHRARILFGFSIFLAKLGYPR
jgi:hypothetical protein